MLKSTQNKGFHLTFENGLTISVQFGRGNYCANRWNDNGRDFTECEDAEIAIWDDRGNEYLFGNDTVKGYVSADEVAQYISRVQKAENIFTIF